MPLSSGKFDTQIGRITRSIDPQLDEAQWVNILGGYVSVVSLRRNKLDEEIAESSEATVDDLDVFERGHRCLDDATLESVIHFLGYDTLEAFIQEAYDSIHTMTARWLRDVRIAE